MAVKKNLPCFIFYLLNLLLLPIWARDTQSHGNELRQQEADRVTNLPGQPPVNFHHYAGYVKLRPDGQKALFYWFFEAQNGTAGKPLVLWLNGGPGCSSVGYGAAQELGPFLARGHQHLTLNKFSWNKAANMLFLESPVGVGFSYTNKSKDVQELGDQVAAADAYAFLTNWFKRFPQFKSHDFYLSGESYAGHYVPQLADLVYDKNKLESTGDSYINLRGFMIGNAVINDATDTAGLVDYAWTHTVISDKVYSNINKECHFERNSQTSYCTAHFRDLMQSYAEIDIYNIYAPICLDASSTKTAPKLLTAPHFLTQHELWHKLPSGYDPCTQDHVENYFNKEDVQKALHANVTNLPYPYTLCSGIIKQWNDSPDSMLPIIQKLLNAGLRIWIYSGDIDGRVPVTSTKYSIKKMGLKVKEEWRPWFHKHQVAGWVETYDEGLIFATVRGAGHTVPISAPHQALSLFAHFLSAESLPSARF